MAKAKAKAAGRPAATWEMAASAVALWRENHWSHHPVPDVAWEMDALNRESMALHMRLNQVRAEVEALAAELARLDGECPEE